MVWKPRVTVAVICEQDNRYLMVEESVNGGIFFNQPAGHLENNESLVAAAVRECQEETGYRLDLQGVVGVYKWRHPDKDDTYLRFTFYGQVREQSDAPLDDGIVAAHWLCAADIQALGTSLRSPLVLQSLQDYLQGRRYPLSLIKDL